MISNHDATRDGVANATHWADRIAMRTSGPQVINDSKTPSGPVHIGALRGVILHDDINRALRDLGRNVRFLYGADDFDPLDNVPPGQPLDLLEPYIGRPLCHTPAPAGEGIYSEFFMNDFVSVFEPLGVTAEIYKTSDLYRSGRFNETIERCLQQRHAVREVYFEASGSVKDGEWHPFHVICERCGKLATTVIYNFNGVEVRYRCRAALVPWARGCGYHGSVSPFDGAGKLPWKLEWLAKWQTLGVNIEGAGKDHTVAGGSRDVANALYRRLYGEEPPIDVPYEFWLSRQRKMSTSKGVGIGCRELAKLLPPEILRFLVLRTRPSSTIEFSPEGDAIPRLFDEYDRYVRAALGGDAAARRLLALCQLPTVEPPAVGFAPKFAHLAVLAQTPSVHLAERLALLKGDKLTAVELTAAHDRLRYVHAWLEDAAPATARFVLQAGIPPRVGELSDSQVRFLAALSHHLCEPSYTTGEDLHGLLHDQAELVHLSKQAAFQAIYIALLGRDSGPRAGALLAALDRAFVVERLEAITNGWRLQAVPRKASAMPTDIFQIAAPVTEAFPEIKVGVAVIRGVCVKRESPDLKALEVAVLKATRERLQGQDIGQLPLVQAYREIYRKFGVNPGSRRPSAEALLRRALDPTKALSRINTVVDAYNLTSIEVQLPMAAYDSDQVATPVLLRFAEAGEPFRGIGQEQAEPLACGEMVYADQRRVICRDWNYRDSDESKVTTDSTNLLVFVDGCAAVSRAELASALSIVCERIIAFNGGTIHDQAVLPAEMHRQIASTSSELAAHWLPGGRQAAPPAPPAPTHSADRRAPSTPSHSTASPDVPAAPGWPTPPAPAAPAAGRSAPPVPDRDSLRTP
jgi:lysyl-tRNA synthetase class 1